MWLDELPPDLLTRCRRLREVSRDLVNHATEVQLQSRELREQCRKLRAAAADARAARRDLWKP